MTSVRRWTAVALAGAAIVLAVLYLMSPGPKGPGPGPTLVPRPTATPTVGPTPVALAPLQDAVTVIDGRFDVRAKRSVQAPTRQNDQSKLFFAAGSWWGVLHEPTTREARIQRLDWTSQHWQDTGIVVDERPSSRADALYADGHLYVVSAGNRASPADAARVLRFSLDPATSSWSMDPDFPVVVSTGGVRSVMIDRASDGTLWIAYVATGRLLVTHTVDGDDRRWVEPFRPSMAGPAVATAQVALAAAGGAVDLVWTAVDDPAIYGTTHRDGDPDDRWSPRVTANRGAGAGDNHVSLKALPDGRLFAAVQTSLDKVPASQPGWDQVLVLDRVDGAWSTRQSAQIRDKAARPVIVMDAAHDEALVFATSPTSGGSIFMKSAPIDDLGFPVGKGALALTSDRSPSINDATSTKQPVDASTGLVVLAADDSTGHYVHLAASLGGPAPGHGSSGPAPDGPDPAPDVPVTLVDEPFDAQVVGKPVQALWELPSSRAGGTVRYVRRAAGDVALQLRTTGSGELRPCRGIPSTAGGSVTVGLDVRLDRQGRGDSTLLMVRGDGGELASLRVDSRGRLRVSGAGSRETTGVVVRPGAWYRTELRLDIARRTFDLRMTDAPSTGCAPARREALRGSG